MLAHSDPEQQSFEHSIHCMRFRSLLSKGGRYHEPRTTSFVGHNTDHIIDRNVVDFLLAKLARCIMCPADFANKCKRLTCMSYTHMQPSQPALFDKRATMWLSDVLSCSRPIDEGKEIAGDDM